MASCFFAFICPSIKQISANPLCVTVWLAELMTLPLSTWRKSIVGSPYHCPGGSMNGVSCIEPSPPYQGVFTYPESANRTLSEDAENADMGAGLFGGQE